jgi:hypothetical protein
MPQARSSGSRSTGAKRSTSAASRGSTAKRSTASSTGGRTRAASSGASKSPASASSTAASSAKKAAGAADARLEAAAQRLRKLNERIIEAGKEAGETTLSSYEKALKAIASSIERGPGSSEIDWISHLATTQAKFIREVTNAWTAAARGVLK